MKKWLICSIMLTIGLYTTIGANLPHSGDPIPSILPKLPSAKEMLGIIWLEETVLCHLPSPKAVARSGRDLVNFVLKKRDRSARKRNST